MTDQITDLPQPPSSRRAFLKKGFNLAVTMVAANAAVYVVGSAFKELDGSLVAGAKCSAAHIEGEWCWVACMPPMFGSQCAMWTCQPSDIWFCDNQGGTLGPCGGMCY